MVRLAGLPRFLSSWRHRSLRQRQATTATMQPTARSARRPRSTTAKEALNAVEATASRLASLWWRFGFLIPQLGQVLARLATGWPHSRHGFTTTSLSTPVRPTPTGPPAPQRRRSAPRPRRRRWSARTPAAPVQRRGPAQQWRSRCATGSGTGSGCLAGGASGSAGGRCRNRCWFCQHRLPSRSRCRLCGASVSVAVGRVGLPGFVCGHGGPLRCRGFGVFAINAAARAEGDHAGQNPHRVRAGAGALEAPRR